MYSLFINNDPDNDDYILDDILEYANNICNEIDRAIFYEYNTFSSYEDFIAEKEQVLAFLNYSTGRPSESEYLYLIP